MRDYYGNRIRTRRTAVSIVIANNVKDGTAAAAQQRRQRFTHMSPRRPCPYLSPSHGLHSHFISSSTTTTTTTATTTSKSSLSAANISARLDDCDVDEVRRQKQQEGKRRPRLMTTMNNDINRAVAVVVGSGASASAVLNGSSSASVASLDMEVEEEDSHINILYGDDDDRVSSSGQKQRHSSMSPWSRLRAAARTHLTYNNNNNSIYDESGVYHDNNLSCNNSRDEGDAVSNHSSTFILPVSSIENNNHVTAARRLDNSGEQEGHDNSDSSVAKQDASLTLRRKNIPPICCCVAAAAGAVLTTSSTAAASVVALPASSLSSDRSYYYDTSYHQHYYYDGRSSADSYSSVLNRQRQQQLFSFQNQSSFLSSSASSSPTTVPPVLSSSPSFVSPAALSVSGIFKSAANSIINSASNNIITNYNDDEVAQNTHEVDYDQIDDDTADEEGEQNVISFDVKTASPVVDDDYSVVSFPAKVSTTATAQAFGSDTSNSDDEYSLVDWNLFSSSPSSLMPEIASTMETALSSSYNNSSSRSIPIWFTNSSALNDNYSNSAELLLGADHQSADGQFVLSPLIIALGIIYAAIIITSFFGNLLVVLAVLKSHKLRSITHYLLMWLAVADLSVTILVMPFSLIYDLTGFWNFGTILCKVWISWDVTCCTASLQHLVLISLDRYMAISDPLRYHAKVTKARIGIMVVGIWIVSSSIAFIPIFLGWYRRGGEQQLSDGTCGLEEIDKFYAVVSSAISFYIPLAFMLYFYVRIFGIARRQAQEIMRIEKTMRASQANLLLSSSVSSSANAAATNNSNNNNNVSSPNTTYQQQLLRDGVELQQSSADDFSPSPRSLPSKQLVGTTSIDNSLSHKRKSSSKSSGASTALLIGFRSNNRTVNNRRSTSSSTTTAAANHISNNHSNNIYTECSKAARWHEAQHQRSFSNARRASSTTSTSYSASDTKAIKTLGIIFGMFYLCWQPFFVMWVVLAVCPVCDASFPPLARSIITWLGYLNSSMNPIIYSLNADFRTAYKKLIISMWRFIVPEDFCPYWMPCFGSGSGFEEGGVAEFGSGYYTSQRGRRKTKKKTGRLNEKAASQDYGINWYSRLLKRRKGSQQVVAVTAEAENVPTHHQVLLAPSSSRFDTADLNHHSEPNLLLTPTTTTIALVNHHHSRLTASSSPVNHVLHESNSNDNMIELSNNSSTSQDQQQLELAIFTKKPPGASQAKTNENDSLLFCVAAPPIYRAYTPRSSCTPSSLVVDKDNHSSSVSPTSVALQPSPPAADDQRQLTASDNKNIDGENKQIVVNNSSQTNGLPHDPAATSTHNFYGDIRDASMHSRKKHKKRSSSAKTQHTATTQLPRAFSTTIEKQLLSSAAQKTCNNKLSTVSLPDDYFATNGPVWIRQSEDEDYAPNGNIYKNKLAASSSTTCLMSNAGAYDDEEEMVEVRIRSDGCNIVQVEEETQKATATGEAV